MRKLCWIQAVALTLPAMMLSAALVEADDKKEKRVERRRAIVVDEDGAESGERGKREKRRVIVIGDDEGEDQGRGKRIEGRRVIIVGDDEGEDRGRRKKRIEKRRIIVGDEDSGARREAISKYWLGIRAEPVSGALKSQLELDGGLVVAEVVDDGPADKAGIRQHDILLKVGDDLLEDLRSLIEAVASVNGKRTSVVVLRKGTERTLKVKPEKRPKDAIVDRGRTGDTNIDELLELLESLSDEDSEFQFPRKLLFMGPGFKLPKDLDDLKIDLPENTSISITKPKDGPARIKVEVDGKSWEVTEDNIDELPEKISKAVQGMLEERVDRFLNELPQGFRLDDILPNRRRGQRQRDDQGDDDDDELKEILERLENLQDKIETINEDEDAAKEKTGPKKKKRVGQPKPVGA